MRADSPVINDAPNRLLMRSEVPHGRKEERRAGLMTPHVGGLFRHLGHEDEVARQRLYQ